MGGLIKKLLREELLNEGLSEIVYHFTNLDRANKIVSSNQFNLTNVGAGKADSQINRGKLYYFSTTTSRHHNIGYAASLQSNGLSRFTLNGNKLNNNYKSTRVDYWGMPKDPSSYPSSAGEGKSLYKHISRQNELEDRIITDKNTIKSANKYINTLEVLVLSEEVKKLAGTTKTLCENNGIIFFCYDDINTFNGSIKEKAISVDSSDELDLGGKEYVGPYSGLFAFLVYKNEDKIDTYINGLKSIGVNTESLLEESKDMLEKLNYYLIPNDDYYLTDLANVLNSNLHNEKRTSDPGMRYLIDQIMRDMRSLKVNVVKDYLKAKIWKGKKNQDQYNLELANKFNQFIDKEFNDMLIEFERNNYNGEIGGQDYNLAKYQPLLDVFSYYHKRLKEYVSEYLRTNTSLYKNHYMLSSSEIRDVLNVSEDLFQKKISGFEFYSNQVYSDELVWLVLRIISDFDEFAYQEIKKVIEEYNKQ